MAKIKLTKTAVDAATFGAKEYELRDSIVPGFLLKVTPAGRKIFMVQYRTNAGERRKPAIGRFGELTVEQARSIAQDWLADVRKGKDPSADKTAARAAPTTKQLCTKLMEDYSKPKNRRRTVESNQGYIDRHIIPKLGALKVREVTRSDVSGLITRMKKTPVTANRVLSCLRKMFNMAEVWGFRDDGTNPCRHIPKYPEGGKTRLITDDEMVRLFGYLQRAEVEGLEHPFLTLGIRLQFAFAARMSEIINMKWDWVDFANRRIVWPDSKTGEISKPMSEDAFILLSTVPRLEDSPYVVPSIFKPERPMSQYTYFKGWKRILKRAKVPHVGTHGIRHRATTEIANSGVPVKVGMQLTAHKTVTQFMRYVHTEDDPVRAAAEIVASRRNTLLQVVANAPESAAPTISAPAPPPPALVEDGRYTSRTKLGAYRPFRHRCGANREVPPGTKRAADRQDDTLGTRRAHRGLSETSSPA
ncbi:tyrosine-type recombinase/integrase [Dongia deserti]|uniref:tyrosine-type recombinase/integrase n=1 Tax=Dongia deserti TaxID=2268030 RepID=UPI000E653E5A